MPDVTVSIDFSALAQEIVNAFMEGLQRTFQPLPVTFVDWVLRGIQNLLNAQSRFNFLTHIPVEWTSQYPVVISLWQELWKWEAGLVAVVLAIQAYRVMSGRADLFEVLFRTGFFVMLGGSMLIWSTLIFNVVNAISNAVGTSKIDITEHGSNDVILGGILVVGGVFVILAWVKGAIGVLFLGVLLIIGPFLLTLSSLPIFEGLGQWFAEEATTWSLRPIMVALVLRLGLGIGSVGSGVLTDSMLEAGADVFAAAMFAVAAFWLAWVMDTRIRRFSVGAWGSLGQLQLLKRGAGWAAAAVNPAAGVAAAAAPAAAAIP